MLNVNFDKKKYIGGINLKIASNSCSFLFKKFIFIFIIYILNSYIPISKYTVDFFKAKKNAMSFYNLMIIISLSIIVDTLNLLYFISN